MVWRASLGDSQPVSLCAHRPRGRHQHSLSMQLESNTWSIASFSIFSGRYICISHSLMKSVSENPFRAFSCKYFPPHWFTFLFVSIARWLMTRTRKKGKYVPKIISWKVRVRVNSMYDCKSLKRTAIPRSCAYERKTECGEAVNKNFFFMDIITVSFWSTAHHLESNAAVPP